MSEQNTILLAGEEIGFIPPTQGQLEAMIRIVKTVQRGGDDEPSDFWVNQINRVGILLESLIVEADREKVDELYLTGKISHSELLTAVLRKVNEEAEASENKAIAKAKTARVQRK